MDTWVQELRWPIWTIVAVLAGAYLKPYLGKKGENLATKENVQDAIEQVRRETTATKEAEIQAIHSELSTIIADAKSTREATARIEATISLELWDRQKRWEIKKETFFKAIDELAGVQDSLIKLSSTYQAIHASVDPSAPHWNERKLEAAELWDTATRGFDKATLLSSLVCGQEVKISFSKVNLLVKSMAVQIRDRNDPTFLSTSYPELLEKVQTLIDAIRKELGVDETESKYDL